LTKISKDENKKLNYAAQHTGHDKCCLDSPLTPDGGTLLMLKNLKAGTTIKRP
jgi:hypothetical protein